MKEVSYCIDCCSTYQGSHKCTNPRLHDLNQLSYYYRRRDYLARKMSNEWFEGDNQPNSPLEQEPRGAE